MTAIEIKAMRMSAAEIKTMTGCKTKAIGESRLYEKIEARMWHRGGRTYAPAGMDRSKGLIHFTAWWPGESTGAWHSRVALPLRAALESDGNLENAIILL